METHLAEDRCNEGPGWSWRIAPTGRRRPTPLATSTPKGLDRITRLAGERLEVPAVCATLVDGGGKLVASCYGLDVPMALLVTHALRHHLNRAPHLLVVVDAACDPRLEGSPVVRDGTVRACVGIRLRGRGAVGVGSLLLLDPKPRPWPPSQLDFIRELSAVIESELGVGGGRHAAAGAFARAGERPVHYDHRRRGGGGRPARPIES